MQDGRWNQYTSNDAARRQRLETDDGFVLFYLFDDLGRLESLQDGTGFEIVRYHYDAVGRLDREDRGNGTYAVYGYDSADRLLSVTNYAPDDGVQSFFSYTYDQNGNPESMTTAGGITTYGYDADGQLESVIYPSGQEVDYEYDAAGNRITVTDNGSPVDYEVNSLNQYTGVGGAVATYDDDGNLETWTDASGTTTFSWDPESRLRSIVTPGAGTWTFTHDALGNRIAVDHDGVGRHFMLDTSGLGDVIAEYDGDGDLVARYIHGLGLVARLDSSDGLAYYGFDPIGNTRQLTDETGASVNTYDYSPFGIPLSITESVPNPFRYGGRFGVMDDGQGTLYMRARYYDPATGRFLSPDPIGLLAGPNLYTYVFNSPLRFADPSGLQADGGYWISPGELEQTKREVETSLAMVLAPGLTPEQREAYFNRHHTAKRELLRRSGHYVMQETVLHYGGGLLGRGVHRGFRKVMGRAAPGKNKTIVGTQLILMGSNLIGPGDDVPPPRNSAPSDTTASGSSDVIYPIDPNEKVGPAGVGPGQIVVAGQEMDYTVYFENVETALAAAQEVFVTDCLDHNLDWTTFRVHEAAFGDVVVSNSDQNAVFSKRVGIPDFRPDVDKEWWVDVETEINLATGCFKATLRQLDPETGELPEDPFAGFLPPEDGSGRGQGHVSYSVSSKDDLEDGRIIRNKASIVFDTNEAIWTNEVVNTVGPQMWNFEVSLAGDGSGTVTSDPVGIDCGTTCQAYFVDGVEVELTATPGHASLFAGWSGDDDCADSTVTADADVACTATFTFISDIFADGFESGDTTAWSEEATE
jgi:RHS repeat-associated protein